MDPKELHWQKMRAQEKETRAIIARDFTASRMNATKWAEVANSVRGMGIICRVKFVDVDDRILDLGNFWRVTGDWFDSALASVFTSISIEWLDIFPQEMMYNSVWLDSGVIDHTFEIEKRLTTHSIPYHWEGDCIRIVGHVRK